MTVQATSPAARQLWSVGFVVHGPPATRSKNETPRLPLLSTTGNTPIPSTEGLKVYQLTLFTLDQLAALSQPVPVRIDAATSGSQYEYANDASTRSHTT